MNCNLKRGSRDSFENDNRKRKYNTRSKDKQQNVASSISQSAKEKLDILALLRSKKINKNECNQTKANIFNKWSLLSSDEEIEKQLQNETDNKFLSNKSRSVSLTSSISDNSSSESDSYISSASSCSYGKSKKFKKRIRKRLVTNSNSMDDSDVEEPKIKNSSIDNTNLKKKIRDSGSENNSNSETEESCDEKSRKKSTAVKTKHDKNSLNADVFVLQSSSQVNLSKKTSTSEDLRIQKVDLFDPLSKKDKQKLTENTGPMHFTTHETVTADPHLTSNLSYDITKKCKDLMKEVKDNLRSISKFRNEKDGLNEISKNLLLIGNHINHVLIKYKDPEQIREWRNNLWSYASHYTRYDAFRLLKIFKSLVRIQQTEEDKRNHQIDEFNNDYSGWTNYKR